MSNFRQLALGAFFVVVLAILGYYTIFLTEFSLFAERHELVVHFPGANGLRQGDSVLVAGIREGRVGALSYDPAAELSRRITVTLVLDKEIGLREGFTIEIEDSTLLGGKHVLVDPGPPEGRPLAPDAPLFGRVRGNALSGLSELVADNRSRLDSILEDLSVAAADLREGKGTLGRLIGDAELADKVTSAVDRFGAFSDNAAALSDDLRQGKGAIGRLLTDEDLALKLEEIADRLAQITSDVQVFTKDLPEGKGILPKLVNDEALAQDVTLAFEKIRDIFDRINSGEGNLGRLVVDDTAMKHIESILQKVDVGEGTLGLLISKPDLYEKLSQVADDLAGASATLRESKGTIGKLLNDDALYQDLQRAVELIIRSLEEYREAAPVTTFTSVLFGAF